MECSVILQAAGVDVKRRHDKLWACCPLHGERTPSLCVYAQQNRWYCFGCHAHGDDVDLYKQLHGCTTGEAMRACRRDAAPPIRKPARPQTASAADYWRAAHRERALQLSQLTQQGSAAQEDASFWDSVAAQARYTEAAMNLDAGGDRP